MKLNVTRNLTHEVTSTLLTVTPDMENERHRMQIEPMEASKPSSRQSSASSTPSSKQFIQNLYYHLLSTV